MTRFFMRRGCRAVWLALGVLLAAPPVRAADGVGGPAPVTLSLRASEEAGVLTIQGEATVPDGAWIIYAAYRMDDPRTRATGYAQVEGQRFAAREDIAGWPAGPVRVDAHFQMMLPDRRQPPGVVAVYGPHGERMEGRQVVEGGESFRAAVASTTLRIR
jgi:hypothetical protein